MSWVNNVSVGDHNCHAIDGWDGAVPPSCCTCCLMLGYCVMVEQCECW